MKEILMSIKPNWCKKISDGLKTVEVRKTKPNIPTPFKVYMYETKSEKGRGKVIGEFVCDEIIDILLVGAMNSNKCDYCGVTNTGNILSADFFDATMLTRKEINEYLNGRKGYGYHISNLNIYDTPKELRNFYMPCKFRHCMGCENLSNDIVTNECTTNKKIRLTEAPQSWRYVEIK